MSGLFQRLVYRLNIYSGREGRTATQYNSVAIPHRLQNWRSITDHAQEQLGDVVYVELPKVGDEFAANDSFGSVESVKAVSEIFTPVAGKISETNDSLNDEPEKVNKDPYGDGWMIKMKMSSSGEVDSLLTAAEYEDFTKAED